MSSTIDSINIEELLDWNLTRLGFISPLANLLKCPSLPFPPSPKVVLEWVRSDDGRRGRNFGINNCQLKPEQKKGGFFFKFGATFLPHPAQKVSSGKELELSPKFVAAVQSIQDVSFFPYHVVAAHLISILHPPFHPVQCLVLSRLSNLAKYQSPRPSSSCPLN